MQDNIAIIGSGLMGRGIAMVFSLAGFPVKLLGTKPASLDSAKEAMHKELLLLSESGLYTEEQTSLAYDRVSYYTDLAKVVEGAKIVIECVPEKMALKQAIFKELDSICPEYVILASNTSVMSITEIGALAKHRSRIIGTHFWNPPYLLPLVEVVQTKHVAPKVVEETMALMRLVGKKPIHVKKDVPGFVATRMQHALWREAFHIFNEGIADAKTIDEAVRYSFGMRLPALAPMENADMIGLDLVSDIQQYVFPHLANNIEPSAVLLDRVREEKLGFKSGGEGFDHWTPEKIQASREKLSRYLIEVNLREREQS